MKTQVLFFHIILLMSQGLFATTEKSSHTFLFCLKPEFQPLEISLSRGSPNVGIAELDEYFQSNGVIHIEPWIKSTTEMDRDGDIYLNRIYRVYLDGSKILLRDQSISYFQNLPFILYAEPEYIRKPYYTPNDPSYSSQCSLEAVKADLAWEYWDIPNKIPGDGNILLASVDTGVDYTHPDLIDNIWINQGEITWAKEAIEVNSNEDDYVSANEIYNYLNDFELDINGDGIINLRDALSVNSDFMDNIDNDGNGYTDDLIGWDVSGTSGTPDNDPYPKTGVKNNSEWAHGTHVAGILAATTNNNLGMASAIFNGRILSVKCSRDGLDEDEPPINDGYDGITYAAKAGYFAGARTIINCSWGGDGYNSSEKSVIDISFKVYGAIIVAAAGNGDEEATGQTEEYAKHYPASYENNDGDNIVVSVCALSCNGNWGKWATYHTTADLAAPGENIYSTIIGGDYLSWNGSSMASPNVASVLGLVWSYYPEWKNTDVIEATLLSADSSIYDINPDYIDCNGNEGLYCLGAGMVDAQKAIGMGYFPYINPDIYVFEEEENNGDGDGIINPGEIGYLTILLNNASGWADAKDIQVELLSNNSSVIINDENAYYGDIAAGTSLFNLDDVFKITVSEDIQLGILDSCLQLQITSNNLEYNYSAIKYIDITISLNQSGFPVSTSELRSSPLVIDLDSDGDLEIVIGDKNGFVHIYNSDGSEFKYNNFPYYVGVGINFEIKGSAAAADMDRDGFLDFVITSKSKHLYIFDQNGLKIDYNANKYLMGTPAIGNLDDDLDLEVVIGGYSTPTSSNSIFAINPDGTDVDGFPLVLGEKVKAGVALADFNGNGKDDIVVGTDDDHIYLIYDDGTIASGFPYTTDDKMQAAPTILDIDGDKIIFAGSNDNSLYAVNSEGGLEFRIDTGDKVQSSPSVLEYNGEKYIFFGSNDDMIYAVDVNGNALVGWPIEINGTIGGSIVFSDLDNDADPEVVAATDTGEILALHLDGSYVKYFPITNNFPSSGSPMVIDLDGDNDLEILAGSGSNLFVIDVKDSGTTDNYWNLYRGGINRRGINFVNGSCTDPEACNYDPIVQISNGSCYYKRENEDCSGNCLSEFSKDQCGICGGTGTEIGYDCNGNILTTQDRFMPNAITIANIYPNPFNPIITMQYYLSDYVPVQIVVYNIIGKKIAVLMNEKQAPGYHSAIWKATSFPSGMYFIRFKAEKYSETRKVMLIK